MTPLYITILIYGLCSFGCGMALGLLWMSKTSYKTSYSKLTLENMRNLHNSIPEKHFTSSVTFNEPSDAQETFDKIDDLDDVKANFE